MSTQKLVLASVKRTVVGRKVKSLRKQGLVPANVFGKKSEIFGLVGEIYGLQKSFF